MSFTSVYLAEEALALPPEQRETLAKLLTDSLTSGENHADAEIKAMLRSRLEDMKSGKDKGMTFEEVFGEKLL